MCETIPLTLVFRDPLLTLIPTTPKVNVVDPHRKNADADADPGKISMRIQMRIHTLTELW